MSYHGGYDRLFGIGEKQDVGDKHVKILQHMLSTKRDVLTDDEVAAVKESIKVMRHKDLTITDGDLEDVDKLAAGVERGNI